jgi:protein gp37
MEVNELLGGDDMGKSHIEWTEYTWNPVTGCSRVSEGCRNCYAERMAKRLAGRCGYPEDNPFRVTVHPERLDDDKSPFSIKRPSRIFVGSMTDLFHQDVPDTFLRSILHLIRECDWHTFMILTKRPERMRDFMEVNDVVSNLLLGVSVEDQQIAEKRVPPLLETKAAWRFVSYEPALGPVDFSPYLSGLDWIIAGGETGPGARPAHPDWFRAVRDRCIAADVPFFFKQWGEWYPNAIDCAAPDGIGFNVPHQFVGDTAMARMGRKAAGRRLDGRAWDEFPKRNK